MVKILVDGNEVEIIEKQKLRLFFDPTPDRQCPHLPPPPTDEDIRLLLAQNNQALPLNRLVVSEQNERPMDTLRLATFSAFGKANHSCRGLSFGIYSAPGQGKTTVVKLWAETIGIPFVMIQSSSLKTTWQLFQAIRQTFEKSGFPLVPQTTEQHFVLPPCIVFFDEAHDLSLKLRTGGLLNPMEPNDAWLVTTEDGRKNSPFYHIDCQEVCWVAASTDPGILFEKSEAFYDRFSNHLIWHSAGKKEIARIIKQSNPGMPRAACERVAYFCRNPRKAKAFAEQVVAKRRMMNCSWEESCARVAEINQVDEFGMGDKELRVLKALGQRPIGKQHLVGPAQCRMQELEKMILPGLVNEEDGRPPLVAVTHKGYAITREGVKELERRGIKHRGDSVVAENILG